jgi:ubiquinone/menaquinone biosynthesis C-methylase UbiE
MVQAVSFQRVAPYYDFLARMVFGKSIHKAQRRYLTEIREGSQVLIVGGGTGWILKDLLHLRNCQIIYLETASSMRKRAEQHYRKLKKRFLSRGNEVIFVQGSVSALPADSAYDVVITFFLLDLYAPAAARQLMLALKARLNPNGLWLFSDFEKSPHWVKTLWQRPLIWLMYRFFRLTTNLQNDELPDFRQLFHSLAFREVKRAYYYGTFIRTVVYQPI